MSAMDPSPKSRPFVIIAGGGISGLTLANALEKGNVEYILLEGYDKIAPNVGTSIGVQPNGGRILDQLGCYEKVIDETFPVAVTKFVDSKGETYFYSNGMFSYRSSFLERNRLLQILYDNLKDKSRIKTLKRIVRVDHAETGVTVACQDGTEIQGDILVGCDGVNSIVRREMQRLADVHEPKAIETDDRTHLGADFIGMFGVSKGHNLVIPGEANFKLAKGAFSLLAAGRQGQTFWFLSEKLPEHCKMGSIPKYTKDDLDQFAESHLDFIMKNNVPFRDLWHTRTNAALVALEEGELKRWSWGRMACVGDSVHKMTPHMGIGGNTAMETCAALANELVKLKDRARGEKLTHAIVKKHLDRFQKVHRDRAKNLWDIAYELTHVMSLDTLKARILAFWAVPCGQDFFVDILSDAFIGAAKLEYLPDPPRSVQGTMGFNPAQGLGNYESKIWRAVLAPPLLSIGIMPFLISWSLPMVPFAPLPLGNPGIGEGAGNILSKLTYIMGQRLPFNVHSISGFTDIGVYFAILLFESARRANHMTLVSMPLVILFLQSYSLSVVLGAYCFIHYIQTPIEKLQAKDMRLTNRAYSRSVLATLALVYYVPLYLSSSSSFDEATRDFWNAVGQYFPLWVSLAQYGLKSAAFGDTMDQDKIEDPSRDLPVLDRTVFALSFLSAVVRICDVIGIAGLLSNTVCHNFSLEHVTDWFGFSSQRSDSHAFVILFIWLVYLFSDMKTAGMMQQSLWIVVSLGVVAWTILGPGVTLGLGWLLREHILASRTHKDCTAYGKVI